MTGRARRVAVAAAAVALTGGLLTGTPAAAAPGDWLLRTKIVPKSSQCAFPGPDRVWRALGPADLRSDRPSADTTYRRFTREVGQPDRVKSLGGSGVTAVYRGRHAGAFSFVSFGGDSRRAAQKLQYGTLTGRKWVTEKGIRVGSKLTKIKNRYGSQAWKVRDHLGRRGTWWRLAGYCGVPIIDGPLNIIEARIKRGRVVAFYIWVGAAGE